MSERILGQGTYASVARVGDVAVKRVTSANSDSGLREIAMLVCCCHPNVVAITKFRIDWPNVTITMPIYHMNMRQYLQDHARARVSVTIHIARELAAALAYIHSINIIHCDIKPENILVNSTPDSPLAVVLCDFGISCVCDETAHACPVQTIGYRAPEIDDLTPTRSYGPEIDIWSFGCVLAELCLRERLMPMTDAHASNKFCNHSVISTCFGGTITFDASTHASLDARMHILAKLDVSPILHARARTHSIYLRLHARGYFDVILDCLRIEPHMRVSAATVFARIDAMAIHAPAKTTVGVAPTFVTYSFDDMLCACILGDYENVDMRCLWFAETLYRRYISARGMCVDDCMYDNDSHAKNAALYIATCIYWGECAVDIGDLAATVKDIYKVLHGRII